MVELFCRTLYPHLGCWESFCMCQIQRLEYRNYHMSTWEHEYLLIRAFILKFVSFTDFVLKVSNWLMRGGRMKISRVKTFDSSCQIIITQSYTMKRPIRRLCLECVNCWYFDISLYSVRRTTKFPLGHFCSLNKYRYNNYIT